MARKVSVVTLVWGQGHSTHMKATSRHSSPLSPYHPCHIRGNLCLSSPFATTLLDCFDALMYNVAPSASQQFPLHIVEHDARLLHDHRRHTSRLILTLVYSLPPRKSQSRRGQHPPDTWPASGGIRVVHRHTIEFLPRGRRYHSEVARCDLLSNIRPQLHAESRDFIRFAAKTPRQRFWHVFNAPATNLQHVGSRPDEMVLDPLLRWLQSRGMASRECFPLC